MDDCESLACNMKESLSSSGQRSGEVEAEDSELARPPERRSCRRERVIVWARGGVAALVLQVAQVEPAEQAVRRAGGDDDRAARGAQLVHEQVDEQHVREVVHLQRQLVALQSTGT